MPIKTNEREYRDFILAVVPDAEESNKIVNGYASTFNQPYTLMEDNEFVIQEQVDSRAFEGADMSDIIMQYDHAGRVFARISNNTLKVTPDERGLAIEADLGGTDIGLQLYQEIKGGYTNKMSFGFVVTGDRKDNTEKDGKVEILRTITKIGKLYDVSAVSLPANSATEISARSIGDGLITEALEEVQAARERANRIEEIRKILKGEPDHE